MCPKNWWPEINGVTDQALEDYYNEGECMAEQADSDEEED